MDPIKQTTDCMNPTAEFPPISKAGLPNFLQGMVACTKAGVKYTLPFLPPNPLNLPPPPPFSLFQAAFFPPVIISGPFSLNYGMAVATMIWKVFCLIAVSIDGLAPMVPDVGTAIDLFSTALTQFGLVNTDFKKDCIPKTVIAMIHESLPI